MRTIRDLEGGRVSYPRGESVRLLADALSLTGGARREFERSARVPRAVAQALARFDGESPPSAAPATIAARSELADTATPEFATWAHPPVAAANHSGSRAPTAWGVPAQLPLDAPHFAGRSGELAWLDSLLTPEADQAATVVVAVLRGGPGVGKSTLAVHWAHRVRERFPDGQMYLDLRGSGPASQTVASASALAGLLGGLGTPHEQIPLDLHAKASLFRSLLSGRRALVVLDNVRNAQQVRPLLPGAPGSMVVVTSRNQLTSLVAVEGARPLTVGLVTMADARELVARRLGREWVTGAPAAVDDFIHWCARLPLAMAVGASRAAANPQLSLTALVRELDDVQNPLDFLSGDEGIDVRASFSWSYAGLSGDAARLFRLIGLLPEPDLTPELAGRLSGMPQQRVRSALAELYHAHLIESAGRDHFRAHTLLRAYASELARAMPTRTRLARSSIDVQRNIELGTSAT